MLTGQRGNGERRSGGLPASAPAAPLAGSEDPARALSPGRRDAATAASSAERTAQDVQFWIPSILIGAESKSAPNGSVRVLPDLLSYSA